VIPATVGGPQQWPAFFVVVAEPDLAVLSDPSRQGKELRRVKKVGCGIALEFCFFDKLSQGLVVFITLRVTEQDGTQWLRAPDGWILEKLVLCGSCCLSTNGATACWHDQLFMAPLLSGARSSVPKESSLASVESSVSSSVSQGNSFMQMNTASSSSGGGVVQQRPPFSADIDRTVLGDASTYERLNREVRSDLQMARALVARLEGISTIKEVTSGVGATDNFETRLTRMALLQKQMETVTHNMVELNAAVLVCQQTMSQLIQGELLRSYCCVA
jgi:hypothetical protein